MKMLDILREQAEGIRNSGIKLLSEYSSMSPENSPDDMLVIIDINGSNRWKPLPEPGKRLQVQLLPEIDQFASVIKAITSNMPETVQAQLSDAVVAIRNAVEQDKNTWWNSPEEAAKGFGSHLDEISATLGEYFDTAPESIMAVADTNALLANPDIERWTFDGVESFEIVIVPTVLAELDGHKVNHRNPDVRDKASSLIQRFKEYRRRGPLGKGVPIVKGRISLRTVAIEPDMNRTLPWLDQRNADDRFLASTIEIIRQQPAARTFVVTSDINLQNKAEVASVPFKEVPAGAPDQTKK